MSTKTLLLRIGLAIVLLFGSVGILAAYGEHLGVAIYVALSVAAVLGFAACLSAGDAA